MITILLEKIKALLTELKTNIENFKPFIDYSTQEHVIGKWIDGVTDVYEITLTSNTDFYSNFKLLEFNESLIPDFSDGSTTLINYTYIINMIDRNNNKYSICDNSGNIKYQGKSTTGWYAKQSLISSGDITTDGFLTILTIRYIKNTEV